MIKIYDSYSMLETLLNGGFHVLENSADAWEALQDDSESLYLPSAMKQAVDWSTKAGQRLKAADEDGRVFWREHIDIGSDKNSARFFNLCKRINEMTTLALVHGNIPHPSAAPIDLPGVRRWFERNSNCVRFMFRL